MPLTKRARPTASRIALSRERVLRAALALADEARTETPAMRNLAEILGVAPMALYRHVANKEDLLDGLVDIVFGEIDLPTDGVGWKKAMHRRAISAHEVLLRHPWAIGLMESRGNAGPANLRHHDAVLGSLRRAGFSVAMAAHAYSVLDSYVYGFAMNQKSLPFDSSDVADIAESMLKQFPVDTYPYLAEIMFEHVMKPGYDYANEFEFGLDLVLEGLERMYDKA